MPFDGVDFDPLEDVEDDFDGLDVGRDGADVERVGADRVGTERVGAERVGAERVGAERVGAERVGVDGRDAGAGSTRTGELGLVGVVRTGELSRFVGATIGRVSRWTLTPGFMPGVTPGRTGVSRGVAGRVTAPVFRGVSMTMVPLSVRSTRTGSLPGWMPGDVRVGTGVRPPKIVFSRSVLSSGALSVRGAAPTRAVVFIERVSTIGRAIRTSREPVTRLSILPGNVGIDAASVGFT